MYRRNNLSLCLFALLGLLITAAESNAQEGAADFFQAINDLPLMPGLSEQENEIVVFDTTGGRLVETVAVGAISPQSIDAFYEESLPQLGWSRSGPRTYFRDGEILKYKVIAPDSPAHKTRLQINLMPASP